MPAFLEVFLQRARRLLLTRSYTLVKSEPSGACDFVDPCSLSPQPDTCLHCEIMTIGLVHRALTITQPFIWTLPLFYEYLYFQLTLHISDSSL